MIVKIERGYLKNNIDFNFRISIFQTYKELLLDKQKEAQKNLIINKHLVIFR